MMSVYTPRSTDLALEHQSSPKSPQEDMDEPRDHHTGWSQTQKRNMVWYSLYVESKKMIKWTYLQDRNRFTDWKTELMVRGRREGKDRSLGLTCTLHTAIFKMDNWQGSILCNNLNVKRVWKGTDKCITESLCYTLETNTTVLSNCTPIQHKK